MIGVKSRHASSSGMLRAAQLPGALVTHWEFRHRET